MSIEYPCVHFDKGKCKKFSDDKVTSWCVEGPCDYRTPSNADKIRAMSDNELANLLAHETYRIAKPVFDMCGYGITEEFIFSQRLEWLKHPAEGE